MEINIPSLSELPSAARAFIEAVGPGRIIAFRAPMGAGKTTFISALTRALGAEDEASSPTFSIINEYHTGALPIFHFDFYRIDSPEQALDLGLDDYFYSGSTCLIEWPDNIGTFLPDDAINVGIRVNPDNSRTLIIPSLPE